jgi:hypothetical protein
MVGPYRRLYICLKGLPILVRPFPLTELQKRYCIVLSAACAQVSKLALKHFLRDITRNIYTSASIYYSVSMYNAALRPNLSPRLLFQIHQLRQFRYGLAAAPQGAFFGIFSLLRNLASSGGIQFFKNHISIHIVKVQCILYI